MREQMTPKLSQREREALADCADYTSRGGLYFWKVASMRKLQTKGLVDEFVGKNGRLANWRLTPAGRLALQDREG